MMHMVWGDPNKVVSPQRRAERGNMKSRNVTMRRKDLNRGIFISKHLYVIKRAHTWQEVLADHNCSLDYKDTLCPGLLSTAIP